MKFFFGLSLFLLFARFGYTNKQILNSEEQKQYELIAENIKTKGLPEIQLSKYLTFVAQTHAKDLALNIPLKGKCNAHSWSDRGDWTECCSTSNHHNSACIWNKPTELTNYPGAGYEIAVRLLTTDQTFKIKAKEALDGWKKSSGHRHVIINTST